MNRKNMKRMGSRFRTDGFCLTCLVWLLIVSSGTAFAQEKTIADMAIQAHAENLRKELQLTTVILDMKKVNAFLRDYADMEYREAVKKGNAEDYMSYWLDDFCQEIRLIRLKNLFACGKSLIFYSKREKDLLVMEKGFLDYTESKHPAYWRKEMFACAIPARNLPYHVELYRRKLIRAKILLESEKANEKKSKKEILQEAENQLSRLLSIQVRDTIKKMKDIPCPSVNQKVITFTEEHARKIVRMIRDKYGEDVLMDWALSYVAPTDDPFFEEVRNVMLFHMIHYIEDCIPVMSQEFTLSRLIFLDSFFTRYQDMAKEDETEENN